MLSTLRVRWCDFKNTYINMLFHMLLNHDWLYVRLSGSAYNMVGCCKCQVKYTRGFEWGKLAFKLWHLYAISQKKKFVKHSVLLLLQCGWVCKTVLSRQETEGFCVRMTLRQKTKYVFRYRGPKLIHCICICYHYERTDFWNFFWVS